jgi:hypothetical protein
MGAMMIPSAEYGTIKMKTTTAVDDNKKMTSSEQKTPSKDWKSTEVVWDLGKMMTTINNRDETIGIMIDHQDLITVEITTTLTGQTTARTTRTDLFHVTYIEESMTFIDLLLSRTIQVQDHHHNKTTTIQVQDQDHHHNKMEEIEDTRIYVTVVHGKRIEDESTIIIAARAAAEMRSTGVIVLIMIAEGRRETTTTLEDTTTMNNTNNKIVATKMIAKTIPSWRSRRVISFPFVGALKPGRRYKAGAHRRPRVSSVCCAWYASMMPIWSCVQVASLSVQSKEEEAVAALVSV